MTNTNTNSLYVIGNYWKEFFEADTTLGLQGVFYGDQARIPSTPILCVEPELQRNSLYGASRVVKSEVNVSIYVYHSIVQSGQINRLESDMFTQAVSNLVHTKPQMTDIHGLNPLVTHCFVTEIASGMATKGGDRVVATSKITISHTTGGIILPQSS